MDNFGFGVGGINVGIMNHDHKGHYYSKIKLNDKDSNNISIQNFIMDLLTKNFKEINKYIKYNDSMY
jgi:hypothetical protein